jgi:hypothetical protein
MRIHLSAAWKKSRNQDKAHVFGKWAVKAINDVVIRCLAEANDLNMDYVTFRSAVTLLSDLHALWHTRALNARRGWTIWSTSTGSTIETSVANPAARALEGPVWFQPVKPAPEALRDKIVDCFLAMKDKPAGFALIHELRADVCHALGIHGDEFNTALQKMHAQELVHDEFAVNLDRGGGESLLPSEEPFRVGDRAFYLITLLRRSQEDDNGTRKVGY